MKTYEQLVRDGHWSIRYLALIVLGVAGALVAAALDVSRLGGVLIAVLAALAVNAAIWLRQNPTLKQVARREKAARAAERERPDG